MVAQGILLTQLSNLILTNVIIYMICWEVQAILQESIFFLIRACGCFVLVAFSFKHVWPELRWVGHNLWYCPIQNIMNHESWNNYYLVELLKQLLCATKRKSTLNYKISFLCNLHVPWWTYLSTVFISDSKLF